MLNKLFSSSFCPTSSVILATDLDGTLLTHKTIILENYEVMLRCMKAGMGKDLLSYSP